MSNQNRSMERAAPAAVTFDPKDLHPLDTIADFNAWRSQMTDRAFIITPVTQLDSIPAIFQISRRIVAIDPTCRPNNSGPEVYHSSLFHGKDTIRGTDQPATVGLGKTALLKLLAAAGGDMISSNRMDDRKDPLFCEFSVTVAVQDYDGTRRQMIGTKAIDMHDNSPDWNACRGDGDRAATRKNIVRLCETKALEAAIRALLQLPQSFKTEDLQRKPFIVPKLVLRADHPAVQGQMVAAALGLGPQLYGSGSGEPRDLKEVEGPRAAPALHGAPPASTESEAGPDAADDLEDIDIPTKTDDPPGPYLCECPCGDQREVTLEVVKLGKEKYGSVRCKACYPGKGFDVEKHRDLTDLRLPKRPGLTAEDIETALKGGAK